MNPRRLNNQRLNIKRLERERERERIDKLYAFRHRKRILDGAYFHPISGDSDLIRRDETADAMNNDNPNDRRSARELRQFIGLFALAASRASRNKPTHFRYLADRADHRIRKSPLARAEMAREIISGRVAYSSRGARIDRYPHRSRDDERRRPRRE